MNDIIELSLQTIRESLRIGDIIEFTQQPLSMINQQQYRVSGIKSYKFDESVNYTFMLLNTQYNLSNNATGRKVTTSFDLSAGLMAISHEISIDDVKNILIGDLDRTKLNPSLMQFLDIPYEANPKIIEGTMHDGDLRKTGDKTPLMQKFCYECYAGKSGNFLLDIEIFEQSTLAYLTTLISAHDVIAQIIAKR